MSLPSHYCRRWFLLAAAIAALGCRQGEQIHSYDVPKEKPRGEVAAATGALSAEATDRMLAAILPEGQRAWFFKVVGPVAAIDQHAEQISAFFATIHPAGDQPLPKWTLPAGWTQQPASAMRAATVVIPADKPLELTVTSLGWTGSQDDLLRNVNRWRGQMRLPEISPKQLADSTSEINVGDTTMTVVDLRGRFQSGGMMAPFAGGGVGAASRAAQDGGTALPAGHPPIGPSAAAHPDVPKFDAPPSWQAAPSSEFSRAVFTVADGARTARVTVTEFAANSGPMITDSLANVNRWRSEIGLAPVDKDSLVKVTEPMLVDGQAAIYMAAIPDATKPEEPQSDLAVLAAMVPEGQRIWFFKIKGDRDLVAAEQEHFKDFLKSVRFAADQGATDGK